MSPRELDLAVVQRRAETMRQLLSDLRTVGPVTSAQLQDDRMLRYGIERILTQLVDLATAINGHVAAAVSGRAPEDYRSSFAAVAAMGMVTDELASQLSGSVGLRNVLVHDYVEADIEIVAGSVTLAVDQFDQYVRQVGRWLLDARRAGSTELGTDRK